jgi:hypothetical protein
MGVYGSAAIRAPHQAGEVIEREKAQGYRASTLHIGTGFETDTEAMRLIGATLDEAQRQNYRVFVETHRATVTQDMARTLRWVQYFPEIAFNADLSHWYTGLEMPYGDFDEKLKLLAPIFERVGFLHGRIGNSGSMQVAIATGRRDEPHLSHFRKMWRLCFEGFLRHASPEDGVVFAPELLPNGFDVDGMKVYGNYAQLDGAAGAPQRETSDRWDQALKLCAIARHAYAEAAAARDGPR